MVYMAWVGLIIVNIQYRIKPRVSRISRLLLLCNTRGVVCTERYAGYAGYFAERYGGYFAER